MKKGILSLAIAVPTVLFTTLPSLADVKAPVSSLKPHILVQPVKTGVHALELNKTQAIGGGGINEAPGVSSTPRPGKGPNPPRRDGDLLLHQVGNIKNNINVRTQNINVAPVGY